jgi:hypothetical protein
MVEIEGDSVMYIPTITWSHKAIRVYRWAGFELEMSEPAPGCYENRAVQALPLIKHLIEPSTGRLDGLQRLSWIGRGMRKLCRIGKWSCSYHGVSRKSDRDVSRRAKGRMST